VCSGKKKKRQTKQNPPKVTVKAKGKADKNLTGATKKQP